jgi:Fe-S-cluster containining protein
LILAAASLDDEAGLWWAWRDAAAEADVDEALRDLYRRLDDAVAARGPTCWTSGRCCKFDDFGHRLYVTGLEVAWFLGQVTGRDPRPAAEPQDGPIRLPQLAEHPGACPYQIEGLCSTHEVRPLGCRIFFCQAGTEDWQQELYEDFLAQLQALHDRRGIAYRYMDWIAGLKAADRAARPGGG